MAAKRPNKLSISKIPIFCQIEFVQKNRFLYFARLHLVHFIQYSNLKKRIACATVCLQRERPKKQFSKAIRSKNLQDANNVTECFPCDDHGSYKKPIPCRAVAGTRSGSRMFPFENGRWMESEK